jgi:large subunit ribosomal protein L4
MKLSVLDNKGKETGRQVDLDDLIFGIEPNEHAVYLEVKQFLANQRQGTHKTKGRSEVAGSTRKIKKQKGTGTARAGSIKSPVFRGGGTMFGPQPRDYGFKLNKKVKRLAKKSALSSKVKDNMLKVIEDFTFEAPKTKSFLDVLTGLSATNSKTLFIVNAPDKNLVLSSRNVPNAKIISSDELTTYDMVHSDVIVLFESAIEPIQKNLN